MEVRLARLELRYDHKEITLPDTRFELSQMLHQWGLSRGPQEVGWVLSYSNEKRVHTFIEVARGTQRHLPIHLPTLLGAALASGTDRFAFIHSHPGGDLTPSPQDLEVTETIATAAALCGLYLDDHFIVTNDPTKSLSLEKTGYYVPPPHMDTDAAKYGAA